MGADLLVLPSTAVIPDDEDHIFLVRLKDTGNWATIGGAVEPDETPEQCAVREAEEEAGVTVRVGDRCSVYSVGPNTASPVPRMATKTMAYAVTVDAYRHLRIARAPTTRTNGAERTASKWMISR